ncbi:MAG TPA: hypothetical protein VEC99_07195 [Clostridia bacterium]|nr:hypothetical protein [Clostridia bacterium]
MKTNLGEGKRRQEGYALLSVVAIAVISIATYASIAQWTANNSRLNDRNNSYNSAVLAAEAATEQVVAFVARDFANQTYSPTRLENYRNLVPTNDWAANYAYSDNAGIADRTCFDTSSSMVKTNLNSQFAGLYGLAYSCRVRSCARPLTGPSGIAAAVQQDLQLASIPVFQFAIFYSMDLEINPGAQMEVTGKVHSNANLYNAPRVGLRFADSVSAVGRVYDTRHLDDPQYGSTKVASVFVETNSPTPFTSSLVLPIGTNNTPEEVRRILEVPPLSENPNSQAGQQRYYNKADLIITVTDTNALVQSGRWDDLKNITPDVYVGTNPVSYSFITTTNSFYDQREQKNTIVTDIDVAKLISWMTNAGAAKNTHLQISKGHKVNSIYVNDTRTAAGKLTAVRVKNGRILPPDGLTVATSLPLYVQGHFNAPITTVGSTNTSTTKPASLLGDAITVLSGNWLDANSTSAVTSRAAIDTTVNAAFLAGIVPTTNSFGTKHYSGGVENFPRFLENWSGKTLTYNGSMVVMFPSRYAKNWWVDPGTGSSNYYTAPNRSWAFDLNFLNYNRLPPGTPQVRKLVRGQWNVIAAR